MSIRVLVRAAVEPRDAEAFEAAFIAVTEHVRQVPGFIASELLRGSADGEYVICAEWESRDAFLAWGRSPIHPATTAPMSRYWRPLDRTLYEIVARLERPARATDAP